MRKLPIFVVYRKHATARAFGAPVPMAPPIAIICIWRLLRSW